MFIYTEDNRLINTDKVYMICVSEPDEDSSDDKFRVIAWVDSRRSPRTLSTHDTKAMADHELERLHKVLNNERDIF